MSNEQDGLSKVILDIGSKDTIYHKENGFNVMPSNYGNLISNFTDMKLCCYTQTKSSFFDLSPSDIGILDIKKIFEEGKLQISMELLLEAFEKIFYNEIRIGIEEVSLTLIENPIYSSYTSECIANLFENYQLPNACILPAPLGTLYNDAKENGQIFHCGYDSTYTVNIRDSRIDKKTFNYHYFAGRELTNCLARCLTQNGYYNTKTIRQKDQIEKVKDQYFYLDIKEKELDSDLRYQLPDNTTITLKNEELKKYPELLFNPSLLDMYHMPIHQMILKSIENINLEKDKLNILLSGGTTNLRNFKERMKLEIEQKRKDIKIKIYDSREYGRDSMLLNSMSSFYGGLKISKLNSFNGCYIKLQEYQEIGNNVFKKYDFSIPEY